MTQLASDGNSLVAPQLIVPAYFHPAVLPREWEMLIERAASVRLILLNLASGPGTEPDEAFVPTVRQLHSAKVPIAGYVDTNYTQRPTAEVLADIERYIDWYRVSGVFFDRVSATAEDLGHYADLTWRAREMGVRDIAFNHGTHPVEPYAELADLVGTFEGTWRSYVDMVVPRWTRSWSAEHFFHLVYSVPCPSFGDAYLLATRRRAGCVYVTDHGGDNPWDRLPGSEFDPRGF